MSTCPEPATHADATNAHCTRHLPREWADDIAADELRDWLREAWS